MCERTVICKMDQNSEFNFKTEIIGIINKNKTLSENDN